MSFDERAYAGFQRKVLTATGVDLRLYKADQMRRRLTSHLFRLRIASLDEYGDRVAREPAMAQDFRDFMTINVSEFFRDAHHFAQLRDRVLPRLLKEAPKLRIWSAGCSIGCEPYTVAMILDELSPGVHHTIVATDLDRTVLDRARKGAGYSANDVKGLPAGMLHRHMLERADGYAVSEKVRAAVQFRQQNLLADPFEGAFDLIMCRNVVIYFTEEAKSALYQRFRQSLRTGGFLFLGGTEVVTNPAAMGLEPFSASVYRRAA